MKKILLLSAACLCAFAARSQAFEMGKSYISVGYGVGNFSRTFVTAAAKGTGVETSFLGPLFAKYEYAVAENVGFGVVFAYMGAKASSTNTYVDDNGDEQTYTLTTDFSTWSALARVNYHFSDDDNFDPYIGLGMGYRNGGVRYTYSDPNADKIGDIPTIIPFGMEMTLGARYMVASNIGFYAEVGFAKAVVQGGLVFKL